MKLSIFRSFDLLKWVKKAYQRLLFLLLHRCILPLERWLKRQLPRPELSMLLSSIYDAHSEFDEEVKRISSSCKHPRNKENWHKLNFQCSSKSDKEVCVACNTCRIHKHLPKSESKSVG